MRRFVARIAGIAIGVACLACSHDRAGVTSTDAGDATKITDASIDGAIAQLDASIDDSAAPPRASEELTARMHHLLEAVVEDNPDLAKDVLFPRDAWMDLRDSTDPAKAWDKSLASFQRAVHHLHKRTHGIASARFVSFELSGDVTRAASKHREWKRAVWRTRHARLAFTIDDKTSRIDIVDLVAYKGAWYVTKIR